MNANKAKAVVLCSLMSSLCTAVALCTPFAIAADDVVVFNTQNLKWEKCGDDPPWDACQRAVLRGDREKEASEHILRFPKGFKFARHWHDNAENVVVTEGAMVIIFDDGKEQTVRPGGYVRVPAKAPHSGSCPTGCTFYLSVVGPDSYYEK
jgi:quercetin dioxygenase-like cupin family protein